METSTDDSVVKCVDPAHFDHILKFLSDHLPVYCQVTYYNKQSLIFWLKEFELLTKGV